MSVIKETLFQKLLNQKKVGTGEYSELSTSNKNMKLIILILGYLIISFFFVFHFDNKNSESNRYRLQQGMIWEDLPLVADFSYPIYKSNDEYISERNLASETALSVFIVDNNLKNATLKYINSLYDNLKNFPDRITDLGISEKLVKQINDLNKQQRENAILSLRNFLLTYFEESYKNGFVNVSLDKLTHSEIIVQSAPNKRFIFQTESMVDKTIFLERAEEQISKQLIPAVQGLALEIINKYNQPNLVFNKDLTDKSMIQAASSVSRTLGIVREGEIIVQNGEKLTATTIQKIVSYQSSRYISTDTKYGLLYYLGNFGHSALILSILYIYLIVLRSRIVNDSRQLVIIILSLIFISVIAWLTANFNFPYQVDFLIVVPSFAMLAAIVFDSRTAFVMTVTMSLLVGGIHNNDYILAATMVFSGMSSAYTVRDIQNRTQVYQSIFVIFLAFSLSVFIFGTESTFNIEKFLSSILMAFIGAVIAPLITFGILFVIEHYTNIASDLRIKEFDRLDHPLLLKLSEIAPGTYQHTLSVAMLSERCAREINANPLLTKVATYYHDIGKMIKPEYFTENQIGIQNKHDLISPKKSAQIIIAHVEEGIKLAKQYKLPQRIIDFIPMHHGTSLVKHFYAKALEELREEGVDESDFRYPGPKPNSKETAILMICDSAEAISRIESKSVAEIEKIIDNNIRDRINDGQFNECDITMTEFETIKKTIAKTIIGMTHKRVSYKEIPKDKKS